MALATSYELNFAGIPFCLDQAHQVPCGSGGPLPQESVLDYVNRVFPFRQLADFHHDRTYPGRNQGDVARQLQTKPGPAAGDVKIGEWYYPCTATKFSVFRGLATSSQAKAMLAAAGSSPAAFVMEAAPDAPYTTGKSYELTSQMYLLPPRPLAEHGGQYDGLYLITLVDERFFWQYEPVTWQITQNTTWEQLITALQIALNVTLSHSAVEDVYGRPEGDSQLWSVYDNAALLLDAVAFNVGRTVVRNLDGTYNLYTPAESYAVVQANRSGKVTRVAGGDLFTSGVGLKCGNLAPARQVVAPATVTVAYPKYVQEVPPHYYNPRGQNTRWYEDQFGDAYAVSVPIRSGGIFASGLAGQGTLQIQDTAKSYFDSEDAAVNGSLPSNNSGLTALAMRLAQDYYGNQISSALDESYPGTLDWQPEGLDDVVWTYSARAGGAYTRVMRNEWSSFVWKYQHAIAPASGEAFTPAGVGGPAVCLSVDDLQTSGGVGRLADGLLSGGMQVRLRPPDSFPGGKRWKASINGQETVLLGPVGTDPVTGDGLADVVRRGIDGTIQQTHLSGELIRYQIPQISYGVNHLTFGANLTVQPTDFTSGGLYGVQVDAGGSGESTYVNNTFNYYGTVINLYQVTFNVTQNTTWIIQGTGYLILYAPYVQCDWTYWCYLTYAVTTSVLVDLDLANLPGLGGHGRIVVRFTATADFAIDSMISVPDTSGEGAGQLVALVNASDYTMTVVHGGAGSEPFALEGAADQTVAKGGCVLCWKDPATDRWRTFRNPDASSGGGGAVFASFVPTYESTTSTVYVDLATVDQVSFTLAAGGDVAIEYQAQVQLPGGGAVTPEYAFNEILVDGVAAQATDFGGWPAVADAAVNCQYLTTLAAGAHVVKVQHKTQYGNLPGTTWGARLLKVTAL